MAQADDPIITMSARAAVAIGQPFAPWGTSFADVGVARDEISALRAPAEPLVLRVSVAGGTKEERAQIVGDWLCDPGGAEPRRIGPARWNFNASSLAWARKLPWIDAWERCENAAWMLNAAGHLDYLDSRPVALALCACAERAIGILPTHGDVFRRAIDAAVAWRIAGEPWSGGLYEVVRYAARRAREVAYGGDYAYRTAGWHAAHGIFAAVAYASASGPSWSEVTNSSAPSIAEAVVIASQSATEDDALREMADVVRREVPTVEVLRAVAAANAARQRAAARSAP